MSWGIPEARDSSLAYCLAKVLWTGQTKNWTLSFRLCSVCPPCHTHIAVSISIGLLCNQCSCSFVIIVPLCQASCLLRTVHLQEASLYEALGVKLTPDFRLRVKDALFVKSKNGEVYIKTCHSRMICLCNIANLVKNGYLPKECSWLISKGQ